MNMLSKYHEHLKPLNKALEPYTEDWFVNPYIDYNPKFSAIDPGLHGYAPGLEFFLRNNHDSTQIQEQLAECKRTGYIPMLDIKTGELTGYTFIELNHENAQKLYEEERNLYQWLNYLIFVLQNEDKSKFINFDYTINHEQDDCFGIGTETRTGELGAFADVKSWNTKLVLCFGDPHLAGEGDVQYLTEVIRIKQKDDWGYLWEIIMENCSPKLNKCFCERRLD